MLYFLGTTQYNMKRVLKTAGGWGGGGGSEWLRLDDINLVLKYVTF